MSELSREERLLRLISEESAEEDIKPSSDKKAKSDSIRDKTGLIKRSLKEIALNSIENIKSVFGFLSSKFKSPAEKNLKSFGITTTTAAKVELNVAFVNKVLGVCSIGLLIYMFFDVISLKPDIDKRLSRLVANLSNQEQVNAEPISIEPLDYYIIGVEQRDIFHPFGIEQPKPVEEVKASAGPVLEDILKDYSLIGFIGGTPRQVMIESATEQKTYIVSAGDMIHELEIKEIREKSVVVKYKSEEKEWE